MSDPLGSLLKNHSLNYIEMALSTHHIERIENPSGYGKRTGDCGDTVEFFLMLENDRLTTVSFCVDGCLNTIACSNTMVRLAQGCPIDQAWEIGPDNIIAFLSTLPEDHYHCAELAAGAFYLALKDAKTNR
jgi:nitrogen fixation NifU-like protein